VSRPSKRSLSRKRSLDRGGVEAGRCKAAGRHCVAASPLVLAYGRLVHSNQHYYGVDRDRAAQFTGRDMLEVSGDYTEAVRRRLAQLAGLRAETPLPAVLECVAFLPKGTCRVKQPQLRVDAPPAPSSGLVSNGSQYGTASYFRLLATMAGAVHVPPHDATAGAWREALRCASYTTVLQVGPR
jgi:hypothetical protein